MKNIFIGVVSAAAVLVIALLGFQRKGPSKWSINILYKSFTFLWRATQISGFFRLSTRNAPPRITLPAACSWTWRFSAPSHYSYGESGWGSQRIDYPVPSSSLPWSRSRVYWPLCWGLPLYISISLLFRVHSIAFIIPRLRKRVTSLTCEATIELELFDLAAEKTTST